MAVEDEMGQDGACDGSSPQYDLGETVDAGDRLCLVILAWWWPDMRRRRKQTVCPHSDGRCDSPGERNSRSRQRLQLAPLGPLDNVH